MMANDPLDPEAYDTQESHDEAQAIADEMDDAMGMAELAAEAEANAPELTDKIKAALAELHPDPFVQAAVWRTYVNQADLLSSRVIIRLAGAEGRL